MGCQHSFLKKGVTPCPECDAGTVVLDPVSGPKWRLDCNLCSFMIYLPETLHAVKLSKDRCQVCSPISGPICAVPSIAGINSDMQGA